MSGHGAGCDLPGMTSAAFGERAGNSYIVGMPLFDYRCRACSHQFEALVRAQDPPPTECPACRAADLERLLPVVAVTSHEQLRAAAAKNVKKAASVGRQETAAEEREIEHHRREEHGSK